MKEKEISEIPEDGNFKVFYELQKPTHKEATDRASSSCRINHGKAAEDDSAVMNYTNC